MYSCPPLDLEVTMNRWIIIFVLFLLAFSIVSAAGENREYPTTRDGWEKVIKPIVESYSRDTRQEAMSRKIRHIRNPMHIEDRCSGGTKREHQGVFRLDENWYLHVLFKSKPVFKIVGFSDLKGEIGEERYKYVKAIHESADYWGSTNPAKLIRAVNLLHSIGMEKAIAALKDYHSLATMDVNRAFIYNLDSLRIHFILRLLFVRKDGKSQMPEIWLGVTDLYKMRRDTSFPLFPIALESGVPFQLTGGGDIMGVSPEDPMKNIEFYEIKCVLRDVPLEPSIPPTEALNRLLASVRWKSIPTHLENDRKNCEWRMRLQAIRACRPAHFIPDRELDYLLFKENAWARQCEMVKGLKLKWNEAEQVYAKKE